MLNNQVVFISGSSRGIGSAIAHLLAEQGATLILNASTSINDAQKTCEELPSPHDQKHFLIPGDMGNPSDIEKIFKEIQNKIGRLDVLVNNAATTQFIKHDDLEALNIDLMDKMYQVNLRGAFLCIKHAFPLLKEASLKKNSPSHIVNIASTAALTGMGSNVMYCALKAGLVNMTQSLARALAPHVLVNAISPGLVETELTKSWKEYHQDHIKKTPMGRLATPIDIAKGTLALVSGFSHVTGHNIVIDGGRLLN